MLTTSYPARPGDAAGVFVERLAHRLAGRGTAVRVLAPRSPGAIDREEGGVAVRFVGYAPRRLERLADGAGIAANVRERPALAVLAPALLAALARAAHGQRGWADVAHAHWLPTALPARAAGRPLVVTAHGSDVALLRRLPRVARAAVRGAVLLAPSPDLAARLTALTGRAEVAVVPSQGVDGVPAPFADADPLRILYVGRLVPEKGADVLARAWPIVHRAAAGATLEVVGDGPLRSAFAGLPAVELAGRLPAAALADRYRRAALVVVPSRRESFAAACLEAMAAGRAVVATPVADLATRVRPGLEGALVPIGDPAALAAAIVDLLAAPEALERLGASAATRARELYGWEAILDAVEAAYARAAGGLRGSVRTSTPRP